MPRIFRDGGSMKGDIIIAGVGAVVVLAVMAVARATFWHPMDGWRYPLVVATSAIAWPLSRRLPKATLIVIAVVVASSAAWGLGALELCAIPLALASFRAAMAGVPTTLVIPVTAIAAVWAQLPAYWLQSVLKVGPSILLRTFDDPSRRVMIGVVLVVIVALGYAIGALRKEARDLEARNDQLLRLQVSERERVAAEVRTAIARDVHDTVAHHVAAIVVRAQAADRVADRDPNALREAVRGIADEGNNALEAMRRAVGALRSGGTGSAAPIALRDAVEELVGPLRSSGRQVEIVGDIGEVADSVQLTMLWILQEAVTNVMLHSRSRLVTIRLLDSADAIDVSVLDEGPDVATAGFAGGGNGLRGMRERAAALGGTVVAGPSPGRGWMVRATLPRSAHRDAA